MRKERNAPLLRLDTPLGVLSFEPLVQAWKGTIRLSALEQVEVMLKDSTYAGLKAGILSLDGVLTRLRKEGAGIKEAVASTVVRRHGKEWGIPSAAALRSALRFRSIGIYDRGAASVFFDRLPMLGDHSIAFELSRSGKVSNVDIVG